MLGPTEGAGGIDGGISGATSLFLVGHATPSPGTTA